MKTSYAKPYSSPEQIVQVLKSRGMLVKDERKVENYLMNIGYHRLSAYIHPFYKSPKNGLVLKEGTTFGHVLTLYRLCIIRYFLSSVSPNNNFNERLSGLLADFPSIDIAAMGFTHDWENEELWR